MANAVQLKFPVLTLMQCGEPEEAGRYLCIVQKHGDRRTRWGIVEWVVYDDESGWDYLTKHDVIAWQPLPTILTEQELEQLYKIPVDNDE